MIEQLQRDLAISNALIASIVVALDKKGVLSFEELAQQISHDAGNMAKKFPKDAEVFLRFSDVFMGFRRSVMGDDEPE